MGYADALRSSWSVRHPLGARASPIAPEAAAHVDRVFETLVSNCHAICLEHLPRELGYELSITRMAGPLEGQTLTVRRASFHAVLSLQRFEPAMPRERVREIRMVAAARHEDGTHVDCTGDRALARWTLTGSAVGTTGIAALAVAAAGTLTTLTVSLLVIPALMVLRMFFESWMADDDPRALGPSPCEQARQQEAARAMARDRRRWQAALVLLDAQRDLVSQRSTLRPFR